MSYNIAMEENTMKLWKQMRKVMLLTLSSGVFILYLKLMLYSFACIRYLVKLNLKSKWKSALKEKKYVFVQNIWKNIQHPKQTGNVSGLWTGELGGWCQRREGNFIVYPFVFLRVVSPVNILLIKNKKCINHTFPHSNVYPHDFFFF